MLGTDRREGSRLLAGDEHEDDPGVTRLATAYQKAAPVLNGSWQLVGATALGALFGWWLDKKLGTTPWLLLCGALLGAAAGMMAFIRAALEISKRHGSGPRQGP